MDFLTIPHMGDKIITLINKHIFLSEGEDAFMPAKKQITREMILRAALKLLREEGYDAVNLKQLADALGCSTQPVYLSFSGMEELRKALVPLAVAAFAEYMRADSEDGIVCLYGMRYISFSKEEPCLFRFLFMRPNAFSEIRQTLLPMIEQSIESLMRTYQICHEEADILHDQLWMHAHGIASMIATDFCDWNMEKVERMLADCKRVFTEKYEGSDVHK